MDKLIELKEEAIGFPLPHGPQIPILTRVGRKKAHRGLKFIVFFVSVMLVILFFSVFWLVPAVKQRAYIKRNETVLLIIGGACIDHVLSLRKQKSARSQAEAFNIADNCEAIARKAVEKLTRGLEKVEGYKG